jgi:hypothetical protein
MYSYTACSLVCLAIIGLRPAACSSLASRKAHIHIQIQMCTGTGPTTLWCECELAHVGHIGPLDIVRRRRAGTRALERTGRYSDSTRLRRLTPLLRVCTKTFALKINTARNKNFPIIFFFTRRRSQRHLRSSKTVNSTVRSRALTTSEKSGPLPLASLQMT